MNGDQGAESSTHIAKCVVRACLHDICACLTVCSCMHACMCLC